MINSDIPVSVVTSSNEAESQGSESTEQKLILETLQPMHREDMQDNAAAHTPEEARDNRKYPVLPTMIQQRQQEVRTHELTERTIALRQRMERQRRQEGRAGQEDSS